MKTPIILLASVMLLTGFGCTKKSTSDEPSASDSTGQSRQDSTPVVAVKIDARTIGPQKSAEQLEIEKAIKYLEINKNIPVVGYWIGAFGKNKINIAIAEVKNKEASGYTVCAGNFRPIQGLVTSQGDSIFFFEMREPGTDQYDGRFKFTINIRKNEMVGKWAPFKTGAASAKDFVLHKTPYEYKTDVGQYPQASSRTLMEEDVDNLTEEELEVMRNEIYARHGYSFKEKSMRQRFDTTSWYTPMGVDIRDDLTDIEVENIDLIYRFEEYLAENYDEYGR